MPDDATFASLGLSAPLLETLAQLGYEAPTPIQARTIPALLAGRDLIGQAQTGTGKTAAFALPILQQLDLKSKATPAPLLTPTRRLARQVPAAMPPAANTPAGGGVQWRRGQRGMREECAAPGWPASRARRLCSEAPP